MIGETLKIGDKVSIKIPQENREWGYNPCPDGTVATVIGFGEIHYGHINNFTREPGVYENRSYIKLQMPDDWKCRGEILEYDDRLSLLDPAEEKRRYVAWLALGDERFNSKRIMDLPETEFWEGDIVQGKSHLTESLKVGLIP